MDNKVLDFLSKNQVGVLGIQLPGGIYAGAMHFAVKTDPLVIYFSTHKTSKKATASFPAIASLVVGFSETEWVTVQMQGTLEKVDESEEKNILLAKYPGDGKRFNTESIFLKLMPTWWKYTDFKAVPINYIKSDD